MHVCMHVCVCVCVCVCVVCVRVRERERVGGECVYAKDIKSIIIIVDRLHALTTYSTHQIPSMGLIGAVVMGVRITH